MAHGRRPGTPGAPRRVPAVARALDILEAVRDAASPVGTPELVARLVKEGARALSSRLGFGLAAERSGG